VQDRSHHDAGHQQEYQARIESIQSSEYFAAIRPRRIDWAHTAHQHGRVEERVAPGQVFVIHVAAHAEGDRSQSHEQGQRAMPQHAAREGGAGDGSAAAVFVEHRVFVIPRA
jgi:hypothetical protein